MAEKSTLPDYLVSSDKIEYLDVRDTLEQSYEFVLAVNEDIKRRVTQLVRGIG